MVKDKPVRAIKAKRPYRTQKLVHVEVRVHELRKEIKEKREQQRVSDKFVNLKSEVFQLQANILMLPDSAEKVTILEETVKIWEHLQELESKSK